MIKTITLLFLAFTSSLLFAQTTINGGAVKGKWTKANSPYKITDNIRIDAGDTLIIESGVRVEFSNKVGVYVRGSLKANGAAGDSIDFTVAPITNFHTQWQTGSYGWRGFCFLGDLPDSDTTEFSHCKFSYVNKTDSTGCMFISFAAGYQSDSTRFVAEGLGLNSFAHRIFSINNSSFSYGRGNGSAVQINRGGIFAQNCSFSYLVIDKQQFIPIGRVAGLSLLDNLIFPKPIKYYQSEIHNCSFENINGFVLASDNNIPPIFRSIAISKIGIEKNSIGVPEFDCVSINGQIDTLRIYDIQDTIPFRGNSIIKLVANLKMTFVKLDNIKLVEDMSYPAGASINAIKLFSLFAVEIDDMSILGFEPSFNLAPSNRISFAFTHSSNSKSGNQINGLKISNTLNGLDCPKELILTNSVIVNNQGIGIRKGDGTLRLSNSLIANNGGYGIQLGSGDAGKYTTAYLNNSIITGNRGVSWPAGGQITYDDGTKLTLKNCIVENGASGITFDNYNNQNFHSLDTIDCISGVPDFVNPTAGAGTGFDASKADWHLKSDCNGTSIGFNSGTDTLAGGGFVSSSIDTDIEGNPRIICSKVDIGPYELQEYKQGVIASNLIDRTTVCEGDTLSSFLNAEVCTAVGSIYQWQVSKSGAVFTDIPGANGTSLSIPNVPKNADQNTYRLKVVNQTCSKTGYSDTSLLIVKPGPDFTLPKDTSIINNQSITLGVVDSFSQYLWDDNSSAASRVVGNDANLIGDKTYWLEVTGNNGCKGRDSIIITFKKTDNLANLKDVKLRVYPNPSSGSFNITIPSNGTITIVNTQGQLVWKQAVESGFWQWQAENLQAGVYLLNYTSDKDIAEQVKLIVQ